MRRHGTKTDKRRGDVQTGRAEAGIKSGGVEEGVEIKHLEKGSKIRAQGTYDCSNTRGCWRDDSQLPLIDQNLCCRL